MKTHDNSKFIDSFDCVVRINFGVPLETTGTKTDVWVYQHPQISALEIQTILDTYETFENPDLVVRFPISPNTLHFVKLPNVFLASNSTAHKRFFGGGETKIRVPETGKDVNRVSSTGAKMFDLICNQFKLNVSAIGFDAFASGTWYHKQGQYEGLGRAPCHDPGHERIYFNQLEKEGKVKFYNEFGFPRLSNF